MQLEVSRDQADIVRAARLLLCGAALAGVLLVAMIFTVPLYSDVSMTGTTTMWTGEGWAALSLSLSLIPLATVAAAVVVGTAVIFVPLFAMPAAGLLIGASFAHQSSQARRPHDEADHPS